MGGSSGGGGSSGAVDYPAYMKTRHETWLSEIATDITIAQSANPYSTAVAYDPDCVLAASNFVISQFYDLVVAIDPVVDWAANFDIAEAKFHEQVITTITDYAFSSIFDYAHVADLISSFQSDLEARRDNDFKPAYKVGMQNVNAVMSSAFTIGDALITAQVARDVANFSADLNFKNEEKLLQYEQVQAEENTAHNRNVIARNQLEISQAVSKGQFGVSGSQAISSLLSTQLQFGVAISNLTTDANRIKIVSKQEETDKNLKYDRQDAVWDLEMYQYGSNVMASIAGTALKQESEVSTGASVLGGALTGAAVGAAIGPVGALSGGAVAGIGAAIGGLGGLF